MGFWPWFVRCISFALLQICEALMVHDSCETGILASSKNMRVWVTSVLKKYISHAKALVS